MKVGISGQRQGLNGRQREALASLLVSSPVVEFHHGDCLGADAQGHELALQCRYTVVSHPPSDPKHRAFCVGWTAQWEEKDYRSRNTDIVRCVDVLWAFPEGPEDAFPRSGTWMTVRIARRLGVPVVVIL